MSLTCGTCDEGLICEADPDRGGRMTTARQASVGRAEVPISHRPAAEADALRRLPVVPSALGARRAHAAVLFACRALLQPVVGVGNDAALISPFPSRSCRPGAPRIVRTTGEASRRAAVADCVSGPAFGSGCAWIGGCVNGTHASGPRCPRGTSARGLVGWRLSVPTCPAFASVGAHPRWLRRSSQLLFRKAPSEDP
jgi:hypothetical protein